VLGKVCEAHRAERPTEAPAKVLAEPLFPSSEYMRKACCCPKYLKKNLGEELERI